MPITILDLIVIVVVLVSATLAMVRGFVREVLSVASWLAAVAAAYLLYKPLVPMVKQYTESTTVATIIAASVIFFIALIVASYITTKISDFVIDSRVGAFDRALGFVFGAARGILLLTIALLFFSWLVQTPPTWVTNARSAPLLTDLGERLKAALPDDIEAALLNRLRHNDQGPAGGTDTAPSDDSSSAAPAPDTTYGSDTRQNLDTLIQNSDSGN
jgi:membrane protein required for colicin V production